MYLNYYVHLVGIKEVIGCKNALKGKLKKILCRVQTLPSLQPTSFPRDMRVSSP
jgi:hypothetical protein